MASSISGLCVVLSGASLELLGAGRPWCWRPLHGLSPALPCPPLPSPASQAHTQRQKKRKVPGRPDCRFFRAKTFQTGKRCVNFNVTRSTCTVSKVPRHFPDYPDSFKTIQSITRLSRQFQNPSNSFQVFLTLTNP